YPLGRLLVYGPLRDNLGMRRIRIAYTAGEAIGSEIIVFFRALGINVKQLYGMTEASVFVAVQKDGDVRLDTVGTPMPRVEIKISEQGEVMFRTPGVFQGYFKNPEATAATLSDGWIRSGDAGFHVVGAIDDLEMTGGVEEARVARADPAVAQRGRRRLRVLEVTLEDAGRAEHDLALLGDLDLDLGHRGAHRIQAHVAILLDGDEDARLGHAVELLDVDPQRAEENDDLGADGLPRRVGD